MNDQLPREVRRATVNIAGLELEFIHLDNGQRLITEESMERFLHWLESASPSATIDAIAQFTEATQ